MRHTPFKRADRVAELLRHELSQILLREVKDPRVGAVTVTTVRVSDDLSIAWVSYGVLDRTREVDEVQAALERAGSYIHRLLIKRLHMKTVPRPVFKFDRNLDYSSHISRVLASLEGEEGGDDVGDGE